MRNCSPATAPIASSGTTRIASRTGPTGRKTTKTTTMRTRTDGMGHLRDDHAQTRLKAAPETREGNALEVLRVFLKLGLSSFGGPIAHIGYFREEFVTRRRWLDEQAYADLVALCQFLPGPASSQVGFSIGLIRAGYLGGLAAWTGFTLPSAIALVLFAYGAGELGGPVGIGLLHGLKLVAVAIVAQAVWGMARTLCPDRERASIAAVVALIILFSASSISQIAGILLGGVAGLWFCRAGPPTTS